MSSSSSLCTRAFPLQQGEAALPRADRAAPRTTLRRRDRWGRIRRWPFGPIPTAISIVLHAGALVAIVYLLAVPRDPDGIGVQVHAVLTPDLGEVEEYTPPDIPEEVPELEIPDVPTLEIEEALDEEPVLEPLEAVDVSPEPSALSLAIVSKRTRPEKPAVEPDPTPPPRPVQVTVPPPSAPPPRATPPARPRGAMPSGRLRPIAKPIRYPESARQAGIQGRARVAMTIDPRGNVVAVELLTSSGYGVLDEAALASARLWRFAPPGQYRRAAQTFRFSLN